MPVVADWIDGNDDHSISDSSLYEQRQSFPLKWGGRSVLTTNGYFIVTTLPWHINILTCILENNPTMLANTTWHGEYKWDTNIIYIYKYEQNK